MGPTCVGVVGWLWSLNVNWEAWSAVGSIAAAVTTLIAAGVALWLPQEMAKAEWKRQDDIRLEEKAASEKRIKDLHHEVCSGVDRILAYREALIMIASTEPNYWIGLNAVKRIRSFTVVLLEVLKLLEVRPDLSDGAVFSAVSVRSVGQEVLRQADAIIAAFGQVNPDWLARARELEEWGSYAAIVQERSSGVRFGRGIDPSGTAKHIRDKYKKVAEAIQHSQQTQGNPPEDKLHESDG